MASTRQYFYGGCCLSTTLVLVILFALSFSVLQPNWVGFDYNKNSQKMNYEKLYNSGRHIIGVGHEFVKYPTTLQTILLSDNSKDGPVLLARTSDGLALELEVTFQYKLLPSKESLELLFRNLGRHYRKAFIRIAQSELLDVASEYTAFDTIQLREIMGVEMLDRLDTKLREVYAEVVNLQLLNVALPPAFNTAIQQTVIAQQDVERAQFEQNTARIQAQTDIFKAELDADIILVQANASAEAVLLSGAAEAKAITTRINAEADTYGIVMGVFESSFGVNNFTSNDLLTYVWLQSLDVARADGLVIDVEIPEVVKQSSS